MSNIQTKIQSIIGLSPDEQIAFKASQETRVIRIREFEMKGPIKKIISDALFNNGQNALDEKDLALLIGKIINELKQNYKQLTISEVAHAIDLGSKGRLGEFTHIHVRQVLKWLDEYCNTIRAELFTKQREWEDKQSKIVDQEKEQKKIKEFEDFIIQVYNEFLIGSDIAQVAMASNIYSALEKRGKIDIEEAHLMVIEERVATEYYEKREQLIQTFQERTKMKKKGADLKKYHESEIKIKIQAEALLVVFTNWKKNNYKLEL